MQTTLHSVPWFLPRAAASRRQPADSQGPGPAAAINGDVFSEPPGKEFHSRQGFNICIGRKDRCVSHPLAPRGKYLAQHIIPYPQGHQTHGVFKARYSPISQPDRPLPPPLSNNGWTHASKHTKNARPRKTMIRFCRQECSMSAPMHLTRLPFWKKGLERSLHMSQLLLGQR